MRLFINGIGVIAPCDVFSEKLSASYPNGDKLKCIEPDYTSWISPQAIRRMSRILKMGTTSALMALQHSSVQVPDAIITGTGYGCIEDTTSFLTRLIAQDEEALNPTPFMQSTHNTIGSLVALLLQCQGYNHTFVHGAHAFEHALVDAMMLFEDQPALNVLVGGIDESTDVSQAIHARFGKYRRADDEARKDEGAGQHGVIAGEGAVFFSLTGRQSPNSTAVIDRIQTFAKSSITSKEITTFIEDHKIDLVLSGQSGNAVADRDAERLLDATLPRAGRTQFKHLCGEYTTASAFAVALAVKMMSGNFRNDKSSMYQPHNGEIRSVLIYNRYFGGDHSLMLMNAC